MIKWISKKKEHSTEESLHSYESLSPRFWSTEYRREKYIHLKKVYILMVAVSLDIDQGNIEEKRIFNWRKFTFLGKP